MALPATREEFKDYCLRKLGQGAIDINVTVDQIDDRVDEAIEHFQEYHDEGTERMLIKYQLTQADMDNQYIELPDNVIGVSGYLPFDSATTWGGAIFDVEYQYMSENVHDIATSQLQYFYIAMQHLEHIDQMFDYHTAIQFNKSSDRLYIFESWLKTFTVDQYLVFDAFVALDETTNSKVWRNKWLRDYATALIQLQWGQNLSKYEGIQTIGGMTFNGQRLIDDAQRQLELLETQIKDTESTPLGIFVG